MNQHYRMILLPSYKMTKWKKPGLNIKKWNCLPLQKRFEIVCNYLFGLLFSIKYLIYKVWIFNKEYRSCLFI